MPWASLMSEAIIFSCPYIFHKPWVSSEPSWPPAPINKTFVFFMPESNAGAKLGKITIWDLRSIADALFTFDYHLAR